MDGSALVGPRGTRILFDRTPFGTWASSARVLNYSSWGRRQGELEAKGKRVSVKHRDITHPAQISGGNWSASRGAVTGVGVVTSLLSPYRGAEAESLLYEEERYPETSFTQHRKPVALTSL